MEHRDNYRLQAEQAKQHFLRYDQQKLIEKLCLQHDPDYLYTELTGKPYRIHRTTGAIWRMEQGHWQTAESHSEVMTLLDLVCDSRCDRCLSGRWKQMTSFGLMFHQELLETGRDPLIRAFREQPEAARRALSALKAAPMPQGDISYAVPLFDGLPIWLQYWEGDEEFPDQLRWLWDENALMYLKYETMYFAVNLLRTRILELMKEDAL